MFDTQIHVSDLIVGMGGIIAFLKVFLGTRDVQRDLITLVRQNTADIERIDGRVEYHHEWLIRNGMDLREGPADRRH